MLRNHLSAAGAVIVCAWATTVCSAESLAKLIENAGSDKTATIPEGAYSDPLTIKASVTLRGESRDKCVVNLTSDNPALLIESKEPVTIENVTINWQLASSEGRKGYACAIAVKDSNVTLRNCRIVATGNFKRCPAAVRCVGFSKLVIDGCEVQGFEFAVNYVGGAEGTVQKCVIRDPGHCGVTVFSGSTVELKQCVVTGSGYHGVRSTGGRLIATDNLIVENNNRGFYLGNKSAHGRISNNIVMGNGSGLSAFGQSDVVIENNLFLGGGYSGVDVRDSCPVTVRNNVFQGNAHGVVLFKAGGSNRSTISSNAYWDNQTDTKDLEKSEDSLTLDPNFTDASAGDYSVKARSLVQRKIGLSDPEALIAVWKRWQELPDSQ